MIWLGFSFSRTAYQAITRAIPRLFNQDELWPETGNHETLRMLLSKKSIVLWTIHSYGRTKKKYLSYLKDDEFSHIHFLRLRSAIEANQFLIDVKQDPSFLSAGIPN